jgi:hypothetical protein
VDLPASADGCRTSGLTIDGLVGLRKESAPREGRDLEGVELVVLRLSAVDGLHGQGVAQDERQALGGTDVGQPVQGEHALGRHDEIVPIGRDGLEEGGRRGLTFRCKSTWPAASRMQMNMVRTWRSIPQ